MTTRVLLSKQFQASDIEYLTKRLNDDVLLIEPSTYNESGVLEKIDQADVVLGGMLSEPVLAAGKNVQLFQIPWTGVDNLNFELIQKYDATVCNSHSNALIVAEHAVAMMFAAAKKLSYHDASLRNKKWNRVSKNGNEVSPFSRMVSNSKCLVVGYGAIGKAITKLLSGFHCEVSIVNSSGQSDDENIVHCYSKIHLHKAVKDADYIFLSVALTSETRNLFDHQVFEAMCSRAIVINVSRGAIVEEDALYESLKSNKISGAAIDTWYQYPNATAQEVHPSAKHNFHELNNVLLSPHRAGYADCGFPHLDDAIENINRLSNGVELINVVSDAKGY